MAAMEAGTIAVIATAVAVPLIGGGIGLWRRRNNVRIKVTNVNYVVDGFEREIRVYLGIEFRRSGGSDIRYIRQVILKSDQETYSQLRQYFELPSDGLIQYDTQIELPRDKFVSSFNKLERPTYKALPNIKNAEERDTVTQIAKQLSQKSCKIGLVWEDNVKTTWKTVSTKSRGKWV
jgi:hypothetical protein